MEVSFIRRGLCLGEGVERREERRRARVERRRGRELEEEGDEKDILII